MIVAFTGNMLWWLLALPVLGAMLSLAMPTVAAVLAWVAAGVSVVAAAGLCAAFTVFRGGPLLSGNDWLHLDALSAYHIAVMSVVFVLSSLFARVYFRAETGEHALSLGLARRFAALWYGSMTSMLLVLLANNLGVMWVGVEATTLLTAFLICLHVSPVSLEATWKYLIVCSVGVAFAFMGVLLVAASVGHGAASARLLDWTHLRAMASGLDPRLMKLAFIFLLVGFGTKAGLAPMHSWLPDAHSQAPAPVSAVFSGFMLNMALYAVMRFIPLVETATGQSGWAHGLLIVFGLLSILVAAVFILAQHDLKRLLAYCSVEHLGMIALGLGLGPLGAVAALFHTLNHSVSKILAFFAAGRLGQIYGTQEMADIRGALHVNRVWGGALLVGLLALIGVAPSALFLSELMILKAAADGGRYVVMAVFLLGAGTIFVSILRHALDMVWGEGRKTFRNGAPQGVGAWLVVIVPVLFLVTLGIYVPAAFRHVLEAAAELLKGGAL